MKSSKRPPMKQAERVGSLLKRVLGERGMDDRLNRYQAWLIWDQVVGQQIAARARPLRFRQGVLEVQVDHPVWMQQLQMLKPQILDKLNRQLPSAKIEDIFLRKAPTPYAARKQQVPAPIKRKLAELTAAERERIDAVLEPLDDPELRDEMRRLAILQKRLNKGRQEED